MTTAALTPASNTSPAIANIAEELSGPQWVTRFPGDATTATLTNAFRDSCNAFIAAIQTAHGRVDIDATFRPLERAYLMHWAHKIFRNEFLPASVPPMAGVHINWVHPTVDESKNAAGLMCMGFHILGLAQNTPPALDTLHSHRQAIDMRISWTGTLNIERSDGTSLAIISLPRTGMNAQLKEVGRSYGVIKFVGGNNDRPHWSTTGH